ncbi:MAG: hypothetical protein M3Y91_17135, partial [Actinomycetota bacterium]|nr:hypothetical protein [Actinomycetota bacterium]
MSAAGVVVMVAGVVINSVGPATAASPAAALPAVKHIFQIQLENESESTSFGPNSPAKFLNSLIPGGSRPVGAFLPNYYGTTHNSLGNYLAQVAGVPGTSGGGPGADNTVDDCLTYADVSPAGAPVGDPNQLQGCVYPASVPTIADQIDAKGGEAWHGWMEDVGNNPARESTTCGEPAVNGVVINPTATPAPDDTEGATATDQYAARHNPFAYFHSLIDPLGQGSSP